MQLNTISTVAASQIPAEGVYLKEIRNERGRLIEVDMYIDRCYIGSRRTLEQARQDAHSAYYDMLAHNA